MRLYVKGLSSQVTADDLRELFSRYGIVSDSFVALDSSGLCRGFGFVSVDVDEMTYSKCISSLNSSTWKGFKLHVETAGADFRERIFNKTEIDLKSSAKQDARGRRWTRHAVDMSPVTERNMSKRLGWKRDRFGQPVLLVRLRKIDGSLVTIDPSHYTQDLKRFNESFRPRPIHSLSWPLDEALKPVAAIQTSTDADALAPNFSPVIDLAGDEFSLSKLLNLPTITPLASTVNPNPDKFDRHERKTSCEIVKDVSALFKRETLIQIPARLETMDHWKQLRSEIRKDFRSQMKDSMRKIKKQRTLR